MRNNIGKDGKEYIVEKDVEEIEEGKIEILSKKRKKKRNGVRGEKEGEGLELKKNC